MELEGWIPNATGNVSFSAIGDPLVRGVVVRQHFRQENVRHLICAQRRKNPDIQFPRFLLNAFSRLFGRQRPRRRWKALLFVLSARSVPTFGDAEGALDGHIGIFLPGFGEYDGALTDIGDMSRLLEKASESQRTGSKMEPPSEAAWEAYLSSVRSKSVFYSSFRMLRNGKCFLDVEERNGAFPQNRWLADQCYYFLKDSVHQHYHHRSSTDAIIELVKAGSTPNWRLSTSRNLYRKVISLRRALNERRLSDALGVLAYAKVFSELFGSHDFDRDGRETLCDRLPIYASELDTSIDLRRDMVRTASHNKEVSINYFVGTAIALGILYSALSDKFLKGSSARHFDDTVIAFLSFNPWVLAVPAIIFLFLRPAYTNERDQAEFRPLRWIYRLFAWLPKNIFTMAVATASIVLIALSLRFFYLALFKY